MTTNDTTIKSLKEIQRETPDTKDILSRLALAQTVNDYQAAMQSASLVEFMLMQALLTKFIPMGKDHLDGLFSDATNGPISTYSAKIKMSYALGIIGSETKSQLERVRIVRNHFAHVKDSTSFSDASVAFECAKFKKPKMLKNFPEALNHNVPKLLYVQTCFFTCVDLSGLIKGVNPFSGVVNGPIETF